MGDELPQLKAVVQISNAFFFFALAKAQEDGFIFTHELREIL